MTRFDISVIITTYKKFDDLEANFKSISMQTEKNFEVILADDGSDNFDEEKIRLAAEKYELPNFRIITHSHNTGTVNNYGEAIYAAEGKYIIPLSQDDQFCSPDSLRIIRKCFEKTGADFVYSRHIGLTSKTVMPVISDWKLLRTNNRKLIMKRLLLSNCICGASLSFRKSSFEALGGFDKDMFLLEDYPFVIKILDSDKKIYFLNRITIGYGEDGISSQTKLSPMLLKDHEILSEKYIKCRMGIFRTRLAKDYIVRRAEVYRHSDNRMAMLRLALRYPVLSLLNLFIVLTKQPYDNIFRYLLKREKED